MNQFRELVVHFKNKLESNMRSYEKIIKEKEDKLTILRNNMPNMKIPKHQRNYSSLLTITNGLSQGSLIQNIMNDKNQAIPI